MSHDELRALRREVKRLEYELRAATSQLPLLRAMVESTSDGIALLDESGQIVDHNRAFGDLVTGAAVGAPLDALSTSADDASGWALDASSDTTPSPHIGRAANGCPLELVATRSRATPGVTWVIGARLLTDATLQARALHEARQHAATLGSSLAEREVLLREIHHRVKNNLQVVSSMLSLQADRSGAPEVQTSLQKTVRRVRSMALVHQLLYGGEALSHLDVADYVRTLTRELAGVLDAANILRVEAESVALGIDQAIPFGLLLNELVTNAYKHGRSADGNHSVSVCVARAGGEVVLTVRDRGPGLPSDILTQRRGSLGMTLVGALVRQLGGRWTTTSDDGAIVEVRFQPNA